MRGYRPLALVTMLLAPFASAPAILEAAAKDDGQVTVDLSPRADLKLGEEFRIEVKSVFDGYLLLLDVGANGKITQLFPNAVELGAPSPGPVPKIGACPWFRFGCYVARRVRRRWDRGFLA